MYDINNVFTHDGAGTLPQTVTVDAASTNIIDLDAAGVNVGGKKKGLYIVIKSIAAFATTVSIEIQLQTDSDSGFATTLREIQMWRFLVAQMTAGALLVNQALPVWSYQRYLRLYFNVFTNATAGSFFAALSDSPEPHQTDLDQEMAGS
jgi:Na+/serine symporter